MKEEEEDKEGEVDQDKESSIYRSILKSRKTVVRCVDTINGCSAFVYVFCCFYFSL